MLIIVLCCDWEKDFENMCNVFKQGELIFCFEGIICRELFLL